MRSFDDAGWHPVVLDDKAATEEAIKAFNRPVIVHIATHGLFFDEIPSAPIPANPLLSLLRPMLPPQDKLAAKGRLGNEMLRSCLMLAGAQKTLDLWHSGRFPKAASDGILMADEIMDLDLSQTLLITLGACKTGLGASVRGEGSVGLQRACLVAGARNVLSTLWEIRDDKTVDFMKAFYTRVLAGEKPAAALSSVQKEMLVKFRLERGLAEAVYLAAPFVLTSSEP